VGLHFFNNNHVGIIRLILGLFYILMTGVMVFWIHLQEFNARHGDSQAVKSVIFPVFTKMMWLSALSSLIVALLMFYVPVELTDGNESHARWMYPFAFTLQHAVMEGVAFLLMQKGCGKYAARRAGRWTALWCLITLVANTLGYTRDVELAIVAQLIWDSSMLVFYFFLWVLPEDKLFRRPAAIPYAKFWFFFRVVELTLYSMAQSPIFTVSQVGKCGYVFGPLLIFTLFQPFVMYVTLLADSRWWQGIEMATDERFSIHSPLGGLDISLSSAQALAVTMDTMLENRSARLLNFAHISINKSQLLGQGSFSRVYRGTYKTQQCAIKLIYTMDLTESVMQRVAAEATILSSMKHPNIVHIYGVSVLPPSVCILLELCAYGSLSDILRGESGGAHKKKPLFLTEMDRVFLALGCAKGVAALHSLGSQVVHRDIKSLNFLVDKQLNVKLADLELGVEEDCAARTVSIDGALLENWAAPELLMGEVYSQKCDIYSLTLVLWEIFSNLVPFADQQKTIKSVVLRGGRPDVPKCPPAYHQMLELGWAADPSVRPSAADMVEMLDRILAGCCNGLLVQLEATSNIPGFIDAFFVSDCGSEFCERILKNRLNLWNKKSFSDSQPCLYGERGTNGVTDSTNPLNNVEIRGNDSTGSRNSCEALAKAERLSTELSYLFNKIEEDVVWRQVDELSDPVIILTGRAPHIIVKASMAWLSLLGTTASQVFGHCLEDFVMNEVENAEDNDEIVSSLQCFYDTLRSLVVAHCILPLRTRQRKILFSLHAHPIYRRADTSTLPEHQRPRYHLQTTHSTTDDSKESSPVAFFAVYMNNFMRNTDGSKAFDNGPLSPLPSSDTVFSINRESSSFYTTHTTPTGTVLNPGPEDDL